MTTSEQWSVISPTHTGPSAGAFGLSTPIQGLNQSLLQELEDQLSLETTQIMILYHLYFAEALR